MRFRYKPYVDYEELLEINNIAQCALELIDSYNMHYYLIIKTILGESIIFEYGPIVPDLKVVPNNIINKITKIEYSSEKLKKIINSFLIDRGKNKTEVVNIVSFDEALNQCKDLIEYMRQLIKKGER